MQRLWISGILHYITQTGIMRCSAGEAKAKALADMVRSREATNQKLIAFYEKIYDDLMDKKIFRILAYE